MNDKKVVKKLFFPSQYEREEAFLEEMSTKGWRLVSLEKNIKTDYEFEKYEGKQLTYRIEHVEENIEQEYCKSMKDDGWNEVISVVGAYGKWCYFYTENTQKESLLTIKQRKLESLNRIISSYGDLYMLMITLQVITISSSINCMQYGPLQKYLSIAILILSLVVSSFIIFDVTKLILSRNELKKEMIEKSI